MKSKASQVHTTPQQIQHTGWSGTMGNTQRGREIKAVTAENKARSQQSTKSIEEAKAESEAESETEALASRTCAVRYDLYI